MTSFVAALPAPRTIGKAPALAPRKTPGRAAFSWRPARPSEALELAVLGATLGLASLLIGSVLAGAFA